jgi:putative ABC transport system permease protein
MPYSLTTLWQDRQRYLPAVLAVAFSALLIILQCGLVLGMFALMSIPIDHSRADIWVGAPRVLSVDRGQAMPENYLLRVANQPEVERVAFPPGFPVLGQAEGRLGALHRNRLASRRRRAGRCAS